MRKLLFLFVLASTSLINCKGNSKDNPLIKEDSGLMAPNAEFGEQQSLFEALETNPKYNGFLKMVNMAKMFDELKNLDNVTIFAPDDADVNNLIDNELEGLTAQERLEKLRNIINYHIVDDVITGSALNASVVPVDKGVYRLMTKQGAFISFVKENNTIIITDELGNEVNILKLDIEATNGAIHNIGGMLMPQDNNTINTEK